LQWGIYLLDDILTVRHYNDLLKIMFFGKKNTTSNRQSFGQLRIINCMDHFTKSHFEIPHMIQHRNDAAGGS